MNGVVKKESMENYMKEIEVINANENNLKDITINIPLNNITVVTGVSGSGKSSLVFDTIYAESERRFLESISINTNSISSKFNKPNVYKINNLLPAIAISQKQTNRNPRSTVGTVTDISQFVRLLFAKCASIDTNKLFVEGDFSYNNPKVWCNACKGTGEEYIIDKDKIIDYRKSINDGAIIYWSETNTNCYYKLMQEVSKYYGIDLDIPLNQLDKDKLDFILYGKSNEKFSIRYKNYKNKYRTKEVEFVGVFRDIECKLEDVDTPSILKSIQKFLVKAKCSKCNGARLNNEILKFKIYNKNIFDFHNVTITELRLWLLNNINKNTGIKDKVFKEVSIEIVKRIENLERLKLGYLSLYRSIPTLSGGESQRLRLANQLSCGLSGLLYVLDEPTMGLHMNDIKSVCGILNELKNKGNTVLLVEHNAEIMLGADKIIDMGPKGGVYGGQVIFEGSPSEIINENNSLTGEYLKCYKNNIIENSSYIYNDTLRIEGANSNNIKNETFIIPLKQLVVITGVSGAGKSTFTDCILEPSLKKKKNVNCIKIIGHEKIKKVIKVDQSSIGRSPKSNIATYTGIFDLIRDIFSKTDDAQKKNLTKSEFSFNVAGGRCEKCNGDGIIKIDMNFMPDTYIECDECKGKRYKEEILNIKYNDKNISEILNMTVIEAYEFFKSNKKISSILQCLIDVGLDYVQIGQSALTISGGEAQRVKLAKYLSDEKSKNIMYILDEPSVGLHYSDIKKLIDLLKKIINRGNSIVTIEHNLEVIRNADYIIDMGISGGPLGGKIIDMGSPKQIKINNKASISNIL
ncbi:TPA: excinuclease ABC subunit UvrA [Clostridium perfringens]|nr:excinuclease ABC subunit UvrA [Clostridium perfringens]